MRNKKLTFLFVILLTLGNVSLLFAWGYWAHQRVNRAAVFALPENMRVFFYNHIDFITEESVIPDVRKYVINDKAESNRHYVDLELLQKSPSDSIPRTFKGAMAKYHDTLLQNAGLLPWYIDTMTSKLTKAFRDRNKSEILFLAGDLAHYIADAHMPLHTTENHDGQLTGQKGIHAFWESQIPEKFGAGYNMYTGPAIYLDNINTEIWRIVNASHKLVDTVLIKEKELRSSFPAERVYEQDASGAVLRNKYNQTRHSHEYAMAYHQLLNGMIENQLRLAIAATANFWYSAWVNAGSPDLSDLDPAPLTKRNKKAYRQETALWKKGQLFGLKTSREF
jgi:hypothetical protein